MPKVLDNAGNLKTSGSGGTPGGSNTQIQYNSSGSFGGDSGFTTDGAGSVNVTGDLDVDNLNLNGNTLSSTDTNGNVVLNPNGTGAIDLNSDTILVGQDIQHDGDTNNKVVFGTDTQDFQTGGSSRLDISDTGVRLGGANSRVTTILDQDDMSSDSDTALATQQSIKAYVDANAGGGSIASPGGRLTLTSATPVMTSDVSNSTSIYYTPYIHNLVPLYDGTSWTFTEFTELTNTTTDSTVNPAAVGNDSNYDLFVWSDSGTIRLGRGPAWSSDTARGTGAGTTELERVDGILMNKIAITNGPAAQRGTYVGTVRSDGSATIDWELGGAAAGGDPIFLYVWNMYNRVMTTARCRNTTTSYTYNSTTVRQAGGSTSNRASFIKGTSGSSIYASWVLSFSGGASGDFVPGLKVDGTTSYDSSAYGSFQTLSAPATVAYTTDIGLGYHFVNPVESQVTTASTASVFNSVGGVPTSGGLMVITEM